MAKNYHPQEIELKWLRRWQEKNLHAARLPAGQGRQGKFYALVEFPYPSGEGLHMGHAFTNVILDVFARKKRAEGFNVLHPMGWDAFGLPTENYAIKTGIHPVVVTQRNTKKFKEQDQRLAFSYNWEREINTSDPQYYRWTQWIFLQLFKHGLAYKAETPVGWCPACKIILANEEIVAGKCERCGHEAERRQQSQWLLRITKYADRLADELDLVDYPDYVKTSQRNWIGRSEGLEEEWQVEGMDLKLKTFTTWPHTTWGATFMVIAPEHPIIAKLVKGTKYAKGAKDFCQKAIQDKIKDPLNVEKNKEGFFLGRYVVNHLSGRKMPLYIANFAIYEYGTGIVKCTPTHDQRDYEFAKKYDLDFVPVIYPKGGKPLDPKKMKEAYTGEGLMMNAQQFNDMPTEKARKAIGDYTVKRGNGHWTVNYKLRDWVFSRQRYWGEPIPMAYCPECAREGRGWYDSKEGKKFLDDNFKLKIKEKFNRNLAGWYPLKESKLPLKLPEIEKYQPTNTGESPLANIKNWVNVACPECGGAARRETDTMPNWAGSSWYYLAYLMADKLGIKNIFEASKNILSYWLPVDLYLGGAEHTTLHLLYSRFWHKFLNDIGVVPGKEPYAARRQHGVILGEDGFRMSKSRGNIINPEDVVEKFGADTLRLYLMFMGPYDSTMSWNTKGLEGCWRFLNRIWRVYSAGGRMDSSEVNTNLRCQLHRLVKKVGEDIEALKFNTAIAAMMEFLNEWQAGGNLSKGDAGIFLQLLAPFAPYLAEELWQKIALAPRGWQAGAKAEAMTPPRWKGTVAELSSDSSEVKAGGNHWSIHQQPWPKYDPKLIEEKEVTIVVQVNGKVRGQIEVKSQKSKVKSQIEKLAKKEERVAKYLAGKKIKKVVFVPGKLINFVI